MNYLSEKYIKVYSYKGFDICTLKVAVPSDDEMGYVIDSDKFTGQSFNNIGEAISAIDAVN